MDDRRRACRCAALGRIAPRRHRRRHPAACDSACRGGGVLGDTARPTPPRQTLRFRRASRADCGAAAAIHAHAGNPSLSAHNRLCAHNRAAATLFGFRAAVPNSARMGVNEPMAYGAQSAAIQLACAAACDGLRPSRACHHRGRHAQPKLPRAHPVRCSHRYARNRHSRLHIAQRGRHQAPLFHHPRRNIGFAFATRPRLPRGELHRPLIPSACGGIRRFSVQFVVPRRLFAQPAAGSDARAKSAHRQSAAYPARRRRRHRPLD